MDINRIERADNGTINYAGLVLIANVLRKAGLHKVAKKRSHKGYDRISNFEVLVTCCCLLAQGMSDYKQVRVF